MAAQVVDRFADALERHDAQMVTAMPGTMPDRLAEIVTEPAVGTPLPDPLEYGDAPVDPVESVAGLEAAATGVTPVTLGIADYGSVVVSGSAAGEEPASLFVDHHVAVLAREDLVPDVPAALAAIGESVRQGRGDHVVATGPSATADMGDLVLGAHGPRRVTVLLVDDEGGGGGGADG